MAVQTGTPGPDNFAGSGKEVFQFHGLGGNDTYLLRLFDISVPPPPPVQGPPKVVYVRDKVFEAANGGTDTVNLVNNYNPVGFTGVYPSGSVGAAELANVEVINALQRTVNTTTVLSWTITAGADNNVITTPGGADTLDGGAGNDILRSGAGNDTLIGGMGADQMHGGAGNDSYRIDNAADFVSEVGGNGADTILATVSVNLGLASRVAGTVENLSLAGAAAISGAGNAVANTIVGNAAANTLSGMAGNDTLNGAGGADKMLGGAGNDTYIVDNPNDVVNEAGQTGTDRVVSSVTFSLANITQAVGQIENLTLSGTAAITGVGNGLANAIVGNGAANILHGLAGSDTLNGAGGADKMLGGAGNDVYYVDNAADAVNEVGQTGIDTVVSSVTFNLANTAQAVGQIENLTLSGDQAIDGTGNALPNRITGNVYNNTLTGGAGNDTLTGSAGSDRFVFDKALNAGTNVDTITDFSNRFGDDRFLLDNAVFAQLTVSRLPFSSAFFHVGAAAADANDYIVYDQTIGALYYDADGSGAGAAMRFATLVNKPVLTAAEFFVV